MTKRKIIIDADTGNEIDDLYAIARALFAPEFEILGLTAPNSTRMMRVRQTPWVKVSD